MTGYEIRIGSALVELRGSQYNARVERARRMELTRNSLYTICIPNVNRCQLWTVLVQPLPNFLR